MLSARRRAGPETVMLSTFPQELIALISWEQALKEKTGHLRFIRGKNKNLLILHRIDASLTEEGGTCPEA